MHFTKRSYLELLFIYSFLANDAFSKFSLLYPMIRQDAIELMFHLTNGISLLGAPKLIVASRPGVSK
jgi:hypothetical protein